MQKFSPRIVCSLSTWSLSKLFPNALWSSSSLANIWLFTTLATEGHWMDDGSELRMVGSLPSDAAMEASDSWDINLTWSISEKWTFLGLIFPSSDSVSLLLLGSATSKLGFFKSDFNGVALDSGLGLTWKSASRSSIIVGSSTELKIEIVSGISLITFEQWHWEIKWKLLVF